MIELANPFARPWHMLALELLVLGGAVALLTHAWSQYRAGNRRALVQWLVVFCYGLEMELIAFAFIQNYAHAQFTVQLVGGKLPLYVAGVYVVFLYTALELAQRLGRGPLTEALLVGFAACLIDVPFDIAGVAVGWWVWMDGNGWAEKVIAYRWLGVPVTSYLWYLIFGAVLAVLCRTLAPRVARRSLGVIFAAAPIGGLAVIVGGVLAFMPFHLAKAIGISDGAFTAAWLTVCAGLALYAAPSIGKVPRLDRRVLLVALGVPGFHVALLAWAAGAGTLPQPGIRIASAAAAFIGVSAIAWLLPAWTARRHAVRAPA